MPYAHNKRFFLPKVQYLTMIVILRRWFHDLWIRFNKCLLLIFGFCFCHEFNVEGVPLTQSLEWLPSSIISDGSWMDALSRHPHNSILIGLFLNRNDDKNPLKEQILKLLSQSNVVVHALNLSSPFGFRGISIYYRLKLTLFIVAVEFDVPRKHGSMVALVRPNRKALVRLGVISPADDNETLKKIIERGSILLAQSTRQEYSSYKFRAIFLCLLF